MQLSSSKHIEFESKSFADLFKAANGSVGVYIPATGGVRVTESIAKISSAAKAYATRAGRTCTIESLVVTSGITGDNPSTCKWVKVTVTG